MEKSNFSVPPPIYRPQDLDDYDEVVSLREEKFYDDDDEEEGDDEVFNDFEGEVEEAEQPLPSVQHHRPPNLDLRLATHMSPDCDQNCHWCCPQFVASPSVRASPVMTSTPQFVLPFRAALPNSPIVVYSPLVTTPIVAAAAPSTPGPLTPYLPQSLPSPFLPPLNVGDQPQVFIYPLPTQMTPQHPHPQLE